MNHLTYSNNSIWVKRFKNLGNLGIEPYIQKRFETYMRMKELLGKIEIIKKQTDSNCQYREWKEYIETSLKTVILGS